MLCGRQGTELAVLPQSVRAGGRVLQSLDPMDGNWSEEVAAGGEHTNAFSSPTSTPARFVCLLFLTCTFLPQCFYGSFMVLDGLGACSS